MGLWESNWARRGIKLILLVLAAVFAGLAVASAVDPYLRQRADAGSDLDSVRRFELGRDLSADEQGRTMPQFSEYEPGARKIANNRLPNARALDPYTPTRTKQRDKANRDASGNLYEPAISADAGYLTEEPRATSNDEAPAARDMEDALAQ